MIARGSLKVSFFLFCNLQYWDAKYILQQKLALRMTSKAPMLSMTYLFKLRDFGHLSISKLTVVVYNKTFIKQNFIAFHKELRSDKFKCNFRKLIR